ncbi:efflux RND transporter periplasmic adaptor subunit [Halomonas sp. 328]|uniref:efflux RND transporter periplasmic adaptor subunit n=1 Tax=Halomonas sp. 328 TaxID=2776704 RepID=UPI0018A72ECD|nr:efflux RND transporter periplasmic adaptor subunit [Halomonas sp. 328]MBF8221303.1 efflux RND transporter periplasmic adaptor subunit [Halomonas sp. 328]
MRMRGACVALLALVLAGCGDEPLEEAPLRPVRTLILEENGAVAERELPARLEAAANRRLSFRVAGQLEAYQVAVGETVAPGQPLARLDATDLRLQRDRARAALAGAEAAAANAEAQWQRARRLYEAGSAPARDLDAARAQVETARAQRQSGRDALALAERQLAFARLEAPGECRVASRLVEAGENVAPGQPVLVLACGDELEVRAALSEDLLDGVVPGAPVRVHLPLLELTLSGLVSEIGLPVDPRQATWPLRVTLGELPEASRSRLRPGMSAELGVPVAARAGLWVPMVAVQRDLDGHFVYVAEASREAAGEAWVRRRPVTLGERRGERLAVTEGLAAGEALIVAGMSRLHDGLRVRLIEDADGGEVAP